MIFRPILDMSNSTYHVIAQWLTEILEPNRKKLCAHKLKDTVQFIEAIKYMNIEKSIKWLFEVT